MTRGTKGGSPRRSIIRGIMVVALVLASVGLINVGLARALGSDTPLFVVSSGSMKPTLEVGDLIVVRDGGSFQGLKKGDIIVFFRPGSPYTCSRAFRNCIVHRIFDFYGASPGETLLVTKGDNNPSPDPWRVSRQHYIGTVVPLPWGNSVPLVGLVIEQLEPPTNFVLIGIIIVLLFLSEVAPKKRPDRRESQRLASP